MGRSYKEISPRVVTTARPNVWAWNGASETGFQAHTVIQQIRTCPLVPAAAQEGRRPCVGVATEEAAAPVWAQRNPAYPGTT
jgi:hypothetical protein